MSERARSDRKLYAITAALVASMVAAATCSGPPELERDPYAVAPAGGAAAAHSGARVGTGR